MLRLRDIMTRDVVTVSPELSIRTAMELLATKHLSGAPVVAGTAVVGVVSSTDLLAFAASLPSVPTERPESDEWETAAEPEGSAEPEPAFFTDMWADAGAESLERFAATAGPEWNTLEEHTVSEAMTTGVHRLPAGAAVTEAADYLQRADIHRVLVMDGDTLQGIVTAMDIARAVAAHRLTARTYVFGHALDSKECHRPTLRTPTRRSHGSRSG